MTTARTFDQRADEARELFARRHGIRIEQVRFRLFRSSPRRWDVEVEGYCTPYLCCFDASSSEAALNNLLAWLSTETDAAAV